MHLSARICSNRAMVQGPTVTDARRHSAAVAAGLVLVGIVLLVGAILMAAMLRTQPVEPRH